MQTRLINDQNNGIEQTIRCCLQSADIPFGRPLALEAAGCMGVEVGTDHPAVIERRALVADEAGNFAQRVDANRHGSGCGRVA